MILVIIGSLTVVGGMFCCMADVGHPFTSKNFTISEIVGVLVILLGVWLIWKGCSA